jgi:hypothetical protein
MPCVQLIAILAHSYDRTFAPVSTDRMYVSRNAQIDPPYARKELLRWGMTDGDFARIVADGSSK